MPSQMASNFSGSRAITSRRAASTKHGHGVGHTPTRRNSPLSTCGWVITFSHKNASASSLRRPRRIPSRFCSGTNGSSAGFQLCCNAFTQAIKCEPEPMRLTAYRLPAKSSTDWMSDKSFTKIPQFSGDCT